MSSRQKTLAAVHRALLASATPLAPSSASPLAPRAFGELAARWVRSKMVRFVWVASAPGLRLAATAWSSSFFIAATSEDESDAVATIRVRPRPRRRNLAGEGTRTDVDSSDVVDMTMGLQHDE